MSKGLRSCQLIRHTGAEHEQCEDVVVVEEPLELRIEGSPVAVVMRTPGSDRDLALGFLCTEGVIDGVDDIQAITHVSDFQDSTENVIDCILATGMGAERKALADRSLFASSSCGICGKESIERIRVRAAPLPKLEELAPAIILSAPATLRERQPLFAQTGGIHGALLMTRDGKPTLCREDVGRHNAVDKSIGAAMQLELEMSEVVLVISGRASFEIVQKCAVAGIPSLIAVGAPSSLAIELAQELNLELIAFEPFNSDLSPQKNEKKSTHHHLPRRRRPKSPPGTAPAEKKPLPEYLRILQGSDC